MHQLDAMANQNGRHVGTSDENRASWRPVDQEDFRTRSDERGDDNRHWDERTNRDRGMGIDRYGQGQSGYAAGRWDDRSMGQGRNQDFARGDNRDRGVQHDDRFSGRGGSNYWEDRNSQYHGGSAFGRMDTGYDRDSIAGGRDRDMNRGEVGTYDNRMQQHGGYNAYGRNSEGNYGDRGRWDRNDQQPGGGNYGGSSRDYYGQGYGAQAQPQQSHRGKGPMNFTRSDERIKEHVSEQLMEHHEIDASNVTVEVKNGEVTLSGTVNDRNQRRMIEDVVEQVSGVRDVHMSIKIGDMQTMQGHKSKTSSNGPDYENLPDNKKARA